jgi:murein DD-endopeptidase MepM/ murein hydrolase activator NlpD
MPPFSLMPGMPGYGAGPDVRARAMAGRPQRRDLAQTLQPSPVQRQQPAGYGGLAQAMQPLAAPVLSEPVRQEDPAARMQKIASMLAYRDAVSGGGGGDVAPQGAGADMPGAPLSGSGAGAFTMGGGPEAHASRALGNWQSDLAYDLMGKAGQAVYAPATGRVIKISGRPGGSPQFAGYGITVSYGGNRGQGFYKHLGSENVNVGQQIRAGQLLGTLDPTVQGGPHLHLGGSNRAFLNRLAKWYTS